MVVINEAAARQFFPGEEPLGKRIELGWKANGVRHGGEIVGIVADFKQDALEREIEPQLFLPYDQAPVESLAVVAAHPGGPAGPGLGGPPGGARARPRPARLRAAAADRGWSPRRCRSPASTCSCSAASR